LDLDIIQIKIPKYENKEEDELSKEYIEDVLGKVESLVASIAGLKAERKIFGMRTDVFSMEIVAIDEMIKFYVAVPRKLKAYLIQQLQAVYPKMHYEDVDDYNIFMPYSHVVAGALRFANDFSLPIKTYRTFENDPLESVTNALSKLEAGEAAAVQYVFRSAPKKWHSRGKKIATEMQKGASYTDARKKAGGGDFFERLEKFFGFFAGFFTTTKPEEPGKVEEKRQLSSMEQEMAKGLEEKTTKPGLDVNIRMIVSAKVRWIKQYDVLCSFLWYMGQDFLNQLSMRIQDTKPLTCLNILFYETFQENRLTSTSLSNLVHMTSSVGIFNTYKSLLTSKYIFTQNYTFLWHICRR